MADTGPEPSMEDILSSIKRIIAEEGEVPAGSRRPVPPSTDEKGRDTVLELNESYAEPAPGGPGRAIDHAEPPRPDAGHPAAEPIVSHAAREAMRGSLDTLSRMVVRPQPDQDGTLEGLVRDMLRPMMRDWLDANLPRLVEDAVAREIARIAGESR